MTATGTRAATARAIRAATGARAATAMREVRGAPRAQRRRSEASRAAMRREPISRGPARKRHAAIARAANLPLAVKPRDAMPNNRFVPREAIDPRTIARSAAGAAAGGAAVAGATAARAPGTVRRKRQTADGSSPAGANGGRISEPAPRSDFAPAQSAPSSAAAYSPSAGQAPSTAEGPRERPAAPPMSEAPPRTADAPPSSAGSENKYVVWSSTPSDVPRSGPDDR